MHKLRSVTITRKNYGYPANPSALFQKWFSSLVNNNPLLCEVHMDIAVSDENLILCSKLSNLQKVGFCEQGFTFPAGVKALLTGSSRNSIREIELIVDSENIIHVEQEIKAMESERNVCFKRKQKHLTGISNLSLCSLKFWLP
jgi:hypothetical protein